MTSARKKPGESGDMIFSERFLKTGATGLTVTVGLLKLKLVSAVNNSHSLCVSSQLMPMRLRGWERDLRNST